MVIFHLKKKKLGKKKVKKIMMLFFQRSVPNKDVCDLKKIAEGHIAILVEF